MPVSNDKLSEIKTILRSHLISAANTNVTIRQLNTLYRGMEDQNIPYRDFGYSSLIEFLKSIGDTVKLYTSLSGEICVRHVETEQSAHISSLVSRQKKPPKKPASRKKPSYRPASYNYTSSYYPSIRPLMSTNYYKPAHAGVVKKTTPSYSKPSYNGMFSGTGNNNFSSSLPNNNFTNTACNYNSKPKSSFPNTNTSNAYNKTENSSSINTANNGVSKLVSNGTTSNNYSSTTMRPCKDSMGIVKLVLKTMKSTKTTSGIRKVDLLTKVKQELRQAGQDPDAVYSVQNLNKDLEELRDRIECKEDYIYFRDELAVKKEQERRKLKEEIFVDASNCTIESPVKNGTREQQTSNESSKKESSVSKNFNDQSIEPMESSSVPSSLYPKLPSTVSNTADLIKDTTKFRLQKMIENHPEGIWCSELPHVYNKEYNLELEYRELGFSSITEFVTALPEIFQITNPLDNRIMVLNAKQPVCDPLNYQKKTLASIYNFDDYVAKDPEPVPITLRPTTSEKLFPDGVMKPNETVEVISVATLHTMEYIEVNISEVFTPSFFWITLRSNKKKFKAMMNELGEFYGLRDLDTYRIPQVLLKTGLNIACIYANIWHRGIIKKVKPDGFVVVLFYDYGTVSTYHPSNVYFLHTRFSSLPAQAIASGLTNTIPLNGSTEWPADLTRAFVDKVWNIPLCAIVASINEENNSMMITLTDTTDDENDVHINDWMVENNYAIWGKMIKNVPLDTLAFYDEMHSGHRNSSIKERKKSSTKCSSITSKASNCNDTESFSTVPNMASLVQETIGYIKQTHTITQAILLNTPLHKLHDISNYTIQEQMNDRIESRSFGSNGFVNMETYNTSVSKHFNANLNSIKTSLKSNCSETESIQNEYRSPSSKNQACYELPVRKMNDNGYVERRSVSPNLKNGSDYGSSTKQTDQNGYAESYYNENEYKKRRASTHSTNSYSSDYSQSINVELNGNEEFDRFKLTDGTLSFERVIESNRNPTINIKYPSQFASMIADKLENNANSINVSCNGSIKLREETDDGYQTCGKLSSRTNGSLTTCSTPPSSPMYIELRLSEKCGNKLFHVLHLENNGWVCMNEVADAFTNYYDERVLVKLIEVFDYNIEIRYSTRETDPQLFSQLDESQLNMTRDKENKIASECVLTLITLKDMVQLLIELDFINSRMIKEAVPVMKKPKIDNEDILYKRFGNKYLFNVLNVMVQYKQFKHSRQSSK